MTIIDSREQQIEFFEAVLTSVQPLLSGSHSDETVKRRNLLLISAGFSLLLALGIVTIKEIKLADFTMLWKETGASAVLVSAAITVYALITFASSHLRDSKLFRARVRPCQLRLSALSEQLAARHVEAQCRFDAALDEARHPDPDIEAKKNLLEEEINRYKSRGQIVPQETMHEYVKLGSIMVASMAADAVEARMEPIRKAKAELVRAYAEVEILISTFNDIRVISGVQAIAEVWLPILISAFALVAAISSGLGLLK